MSGPSDQPTSSTKTPTSAELHDLAKWFLRTLGFTLDRQDQSGLADWWTHPELGELLVVRPEAGDFHRRYRELISELSAQLGCPSDHDLRVEWLGRRVAVEILARGAELKLRKDD